MPLRTCVLCNKRLRQHQSRPINKTIGKYLRRNYLLDTISGDIICDKCSRGAYRNDPPPPPTPKASNVTVAQSCEFSPPSVKLNIKSTSCSHAYCFICKQQANKLVVVSENLRFNAFVYENIFIPSGSRCCPQHLSEDRVFFKSGCLVNLRTVDHVYINRRTVLNLLSKMRHVVRQNQKKVISFDNIDQYDDQDVPYLTGLTKVQFSELLSFIACQIRNTPARSSTTTLALFLMKLKLGVSNKLLSTLFGISKSSIRRAFHSVRQALLNSFVPVYLGFGHLSRSDVVQFHTRQLARNLFCDRDDQVVLVIDGTYIYIQKSKHFKFQRRSYSLHKGKTLVKPMVIVTSSGYYLSVLGPYLADSKNNDAAILKHIMMQNKEDIKSWVKEDDILVVDRGFRDALSFLESMGIRTEMPAFIPKGQKQMSSEEANSSRLVTKIRWVVESANARIKRWRYLDHILPNSQVPFIGDIVRIVCAISNKFFAPLNKTVSSEEDEAMANLMLNMASQGNDLKLYIDDNALDRKHSNWLSVDRDCVPFPKLDENILRALTLGTYQLKLCSSYVQEYMDSDTNLSVHKELPNLLRAKLQSRHTSSKTYYVWIQHTDITVTAWYCKCKSGSRTVGTCCHVAAVLWYLGHARHMTDSHYGVKDWSTFVEDAMCLPPTIDSSDSDSSATEE